MTLWKPVVSSLRSARNTTRLRNIIAFGILAVSSCQKALSFSLRTPAEVTPNNIPP